MGNMEVLHVYSVDGTSWCKYWSDRQPFKNFFSLVNFCDVNDSNTTGESRIDLANQPQQGNPIDDITLQ